MRELGYKKEREKNEETVADFSSLSCSDHVPFPTMPAFLIHLLSLAYYFPVAYSLWPYWHLSSNVQGSIQRRQSRDKLKIVRYHYLRYFILSSHLHSYWQILIWLFWILIVDFVSCCCELVDTSRMKLKKSLWPVRISCIVYDLFHLCHDVDRLIQARQS